MSKSLQSSSRIGHQSHLPSFKELNDLISGQCNTLIDDRNLELPPIRKPLVREPNETSEHTGGNTHSIRTNDKPNVGHWPKNLPPQKGPTLVFPDDDEEVEEREEDAGESGKDDEEDDEPRQCPSSTEQSQSTSQSSLLTVDSRPILRLSPKSLAEGGPELEAQQHSLLHQYRLPSSSAADEPTSAPPAYVYQTPTAPQPSSGPVPFSFNVLRAQQGDLVNVRTPSVRAQGILRPTAIIEDEDESHKRYRCDWPGCGKKYDRPSSLEVHKYSHTRKQPFPCPETGCSRAFSVKSNMLRHFRSHPKRGGMSAAEVSAASAKKAASIAAAAEKEADDAIQSLKDKEKGKEKEVESNSEVNTEKESKQAKSATSASSRKLPILTLTPAPSILSSASRTHPGARSRTTLDTASAAGLSSSAPRMSEANASEDSPTVSVSIPISPSASPSPSPLLSPHSPHSTYSSEPTSASVMSTGLLSPSFASTSAPASVAFSPPSELLSPHSMYSPNSPYSPHSPALFTTAEKEREAGKEAEGHAPELPLQAMSDREHERSLSKSPVPTTISTATPNQTASSTISARSLSPQHVQSSSPTVTRSPSPFSPRFGTHTLYPVSDTRSSPGQGYWPSTPLDSGGRKFVLTMSKSDTTTKLHSPPRSASPGTSSPSRRTDKRKRSDADNNDSNTDQTPDQGSLSGSGKSTTDSHKGVAESLQPELSAAKEKVSKQGFWPPAPKPTRDFQRAFVESNTTMKEVSEQGFWPPALKPTRDFQRAFVGAARSESSTAMKEVTQQNLESSPSTSKSTRDVHETSADISQAESSVATKADSPSRSISTGPSGAPMETSSVPISETNPSSPRHLNKRRRTESDNNDDMFEKSSDQDNQSAACEPTSVSHGSASVTDRGCFPPPPKPVGSFQRRFVTRSIESSTTTTDSPPRSQGPGAASPASRKTPSPTISESHLSRHLSTREMRDNDTGDDGTEEASEQIHRPSTSKQIDDRLRDVIEALPRRSASPGPTTLRFAPIRSKRTFSSVRIPGPDRRLPAGSHSDGEESQQEEGFWPTSLPPQTKAFFEAPLFNDEDNEKEDPGGGGSGDEMDVDEAAGGKKQLPFAFGRKGRSLSLKPGLAEEIEKQKGVKSMET